MKQRPTRRLFLVWLIGVTVSPGLVSASDAESVQPRFPDDRNSDVMVLATYHFASLVKHEINVETDDIFHPTRQKEIDAVVEALKPFSPTMIALEAESEYNAVFNDFYSKYLDGSWDSSGSEGMQMLERSELFQIGFRLAKELSLERIYAVDEMTVRPLERMFEFAESHGYEQFLAHRDRRFREIEDSWEGDLSSKTIGQLLLKLNSPKDIAVSNSSYIALIRFGNELEQPGVDVHVEWYRRNVLIFQSLYNMTKGRSGERILMIYGADHASQLRELIESSPDFNLVEVSEFLSVLDK